MFVLRSAFWLAVGFVVMAPHGTDLGGAATALGNRAVATAVGAGEQLLVSKLTQPYSSSALLDVTAVPSVDLPMQDSPTAPVVFPRPRAAQMG